MYYIYRSIDQTIIQVKRLLNDLLIYLTQNKEVSKRIVFSKGFYPCSLTTKKCHFLEDNYLMLQLINVMLLCFLEVIDFLKDIKS